MAVAPVARWRERSRGAGGRRRAEAAAEKAVAEGNDSAEEVEAAFEAGLEVGRREARAGGPERVELDRICTEEALEPLDSEAHLRIEPALLEIGAAQRALRQAEANAVRVVCAEIEEAEHELAARRA